MKYCPVCGTEKKQDDTKCQNCGLDFETTLAATEQKTIFFAPKTIEEGKIIGGRYRIDSMIGKGGMGRVYRARDLQLDETVALKMLESELTSENMIQRFIREIKLARTVTHENVCRIYDLVEMGGFRFISMQFIDGTDLKTLLADKGKIGMEQGLSIISDILHALEAIHKKGIVHRDLKPANIMIDTEGKAYITDFGIAKSETAQDLTRSGEMIGTPHYMAPEQIKAKATDNRTDIYSLGVMMYHMFTGKTPFAADSSISLAMMHMTETPPPPKDINPELPGELSTIITRCLEKEPAKRFASVSNLHAALKQASKTKDEVSGSAPTISSEIAKPKRGIIWIVASLMILISSFAVLKFIVLAPTDEAPSDKKKPLLNNMVFVKGGRVLLGTDKFGEDGNPLHSAVIDDLYIDKFEVTNKEYAAFIQQTGHPAPSTWESAKHPPEQDDFPVTAVTRDDAEGYCRWSGKRLPSADEWECAARTTENFYYPWGNEFTKSNANIATGNLQPVGSAKADKNQLGIFDLAGNVSEWTSTEIKNEGKKFYIYRGGSFAQKISVESARLTYRRGVRANKKEAYRNIGFRCVVSKKDIEEADNKKSPGS